MAKKLWPCMVCGKRYAELEDAEVCERSHDQREPPAPASYVPGWAVK